MELKQAIQTPTDLREEDKANSKKLFDMSSGDLTRMDNAAHPNLVGLVQSALRFDADITPRDFDQSDPSSVTTVFLMWKLDFTNRALQNSLSRLQNRDTPANGNAAVNNSLSAPEELQTNSQPGNDISPLPANPFNHDTTRPSVINPLAIANVLQSNGQKRSYEGITLTSQQDPKRDRFCNLVDIDGAQQGTVNNIPNPDFRGGGCPTERLPPHLMREYIGRQNTRQVLRVFEYKGAEILAGLLREGVTVEMAVRNRFWKRSISGDPFQSEQEAINLAKIIHLTLMVFPTVEDALIASWLETCLHRLYAILYVESHTEVTPRATLWKIVQSVLETTAGSSLQVPSMEKGMAQHVTLMSKEQTALNSLSRKNGRQPTIVTNNRKKNPNNGTSRSVLKPGHGHSRFHESLNDVVSVTKV